MKILYRHKLYLLLAGILLAIAVFMLSIILNSPPPTSVVDIPNAPTPSPITTKTNPPIDYSPSQTNKLIEKLTNRTQLSSNDLTAKEKIILLIPQGQVSGIVYRSSTIQIEYINAADEIQVEILTIDIAQAKNDAGVWLKSQGLTQEGICNLPVVFYLNRGVANTLMDSNIIFNPLAEGC